MTRLEEIRLLAKYDFEEIEGNTRYLLKLVDELAGALRDMRDFHSHGGGSIAATEALAKLQEPSDGRACDCAASTEGKWADIHSPGCASLTEHDRAGNGGRQAARGGGQEAEKALRTSPTLSVPEDKADD